MSTSVCLSVCLSVCEHISGVTRAIFTNFFVHAAYARGSVLFRGRIRIGHLIESTYSLGVLCDQTHTKDQFDLLRRL